MDDCNCPTKVLEYWDETKGWFGDFRPFELLTELPDNYRMHRSRTRGVTNLLASLGATR